jgi:hypothetical protein
VSEQQVQQLRWVRSAGGKRRNAWLISKRGEVIDAGQAHDLPPSMGLLCLLGAGMGSEVGCWSSLTPFINHDRRAGGAVRFLSPSHPCSCYQFVAPNQSTGRVAAKHYSLTRF